MIFSDYAYMCLADMAARTMERDGLFPELDVKQLREATGAAMAAAQEAAKERRAMLSKLPCDDCGHALGKHDWDADSCNGAAAGGTPCDCLPDDDEEAFP